MTRIIIEKIIWNIWNKTHIQKHGVSKKEIFEASKYIICHWRTYNKRYLAIGRSGSRLISMVLTHKETKTYYLITARDTSSKERRKVYEYEKEKKQNS